MKKTLLSLFLCLSAIIAIAQVTDFITGINGPSGLFIDGDDLYVSEYNIGQVSKINLNENPPSKTSVMTNRSSPFGLVVIGNYLYVAEQTANRISYADISIPIIVPTSIFMGSSPSGLAVGDSILYSAAGNSIYKINTTGSNPTPEPVLLGGLANPTGLAVIGNELFIANYTSKTIDKIDLTAATPELVNVVAAGINNPNHLFAYGDELYFSQFTSDGKISKVNVTEANPIVIDVANGFNPTGIAIKDDILYFSQYGGNKISKLELVVGIEQPDTEGQLLVYPNPASDYLIFDDLVSTIDATIIDVSGKVVKTLKTDGLIDVGNLPSGIYFIQSEGFPAIKFVKR